MLIDTVLVPQGAEYRAVCRGLTLAKANEPTVVPVPIGDRPLTNYLRKWQPTQIQSKILLMGLCGSLSPVFPLGEAVLYESCTDAATTTQQYCDRSLTAALRQQLQIPLVRGLTCDRFIWSSAHKQRLEQCHKADVVDMEGFAALSVLSPKAVAMVRVVSDDCHRDLPNLNPAICADGTLQPVQLAYSFCKQPQAAVRLIQGSVQGLKRLQQVTAQLFSRGERTRLPCR